MKANKTTRECHLRRLQGGLFCHDSRRVAVLGSQRGKAICLIQKQSQYIWLFLGDRQILEGFWVFLLILSPYTIDVALGGFRQSCTEQLLLYTATTHPDCSCIFPHLKDYISSRRGCCIRYGLGLRLYQIVSVPWWLCQVPCIPWPLVSLGPWSRQLCELLRSLHQKCRYIHSIGRPSFTRCLDTHPDLATEDVLICRSYSSQFQGFFFTSWFVHVILAYRPC